MKSLLKKSKAAFQKDIGDAGFREVVKGSAGTFIIRIGGMIAGYAFIFLISRFYGSEVLGAHTLSVTVLMMFTVAGRLGMDTAIVRHFAQDYQSGRWDRVLEVYLKTLQVIIPFGILLSVILFFSSGILANVIFKKPLLEPYFKVISFAVLPMTLRFVNSECYRGFRMNKEYAYSQNVGYFLYGSVILGIGTLFTTHEWMPNIAFALSLTFLAISSSAMIFRKIKSNTQVASDEYRKSEMVRSSLPMLLSSSLVLLSGWINTIMLGIFSTESDVGVFSVILKIATFSSLALMSINSISAPRFAQLYAKNDMQGLAVYTSHTAKVIFFSSVPIFTGIIVFREWLMGLFGPDFLIGTQALVVTMIGQMFNVFAGSVGHFLNMTGKQHVFRNIVLISAAINIIACFFLIPTMGLMGSAIAGMLFLACWNLMSMIYIKRTYSIRTYYWPFGK
ncbi:MAG: flippase [Bacteroidia bacterium]|nr:flippase [Bacteroidia bacterium]